MPFRFDKSYGNADTNVNVGQRRPYQTLLSMIIFYQRLMELTPPLQLLNAAKTRLKPITFSRRVLYCLRHLVPLVLRLCLTVNRFFRDVGMRGWTGGADGTKVMVFEVDMPHCDEETCTWNRPAIWALNAKVRQRSSFLLSCFVAPLCIALTVATYRNQQQPSTQELTQNSTQHHRQMLSEGHNTEELRVTQ